MRGIVGVGIDVVDIARFAAALARTPRLRERLFTPAERDLPVRSLAARFAAKEAVAKALGAPGDLRWHDCVVVGARSAPPALEVSGSVAARAAALGVTRWHLSLSHDGGVATALVVAEGEEPCPAVTAARG
jgi:holo-[acyl-carrier protein] synthase